MSKTKLLDFSAEIYRQLKNADVLPESILIKVTLMLFLADYQERVQQISAEEAELSAKVEQIKLILENPDVVAALRQDKLYNLQVLRDNYGVNLYPNNLSLNLKMGSLPQKC